MPGKTWMTLAVVVAASVALPLCGALATSSAASEPAATRLLVSSRKAAPLWKLEELAVRPLDAFKECDVCPEMVAIPTGAFMMGAPDDEESSEDNERPLRKVTLARAFAVGRFAVTFDEWDACVAAGGCRNFRPSDNSWGRGRRPVINVRWDDARSYVRWLSDRTGKRYRLLSEAEREYVTRAGTATPFWWGSSLTTDRANYDGDFVYPLRGGLRGERGRKTLPVDSFEPNPWGLYQMHGNVYEWVEDCWHPNYVGAPTDGSARAHDDCERRVLRGGAWNVASWHLRAASRGALASALGTLPTGLRVARDLDR